MKCGSYPAWLDNINTTAHNIALLWMYSKVGNDLCNSFLNNSYWGMALRVHYNPFTDANLIVIVDDDDWMQ